jgi:hypothetical protein
MKRLEKITMRKLIFLGALVMTVALSAGAAVRFEATTVSTDEKGREQEQFVVEAWVDGERARVEFRDSGLDMVSKGSYLVTTDGGQVVFMVDPEKQTYSRWDLDALLQAVGNLSAMSGGMVQMKFDNADVEDLGNQPGEPVAGLSTRVYRFQSTYDMRMKVMGFKKAYHVESDEEIWASPELDDPGFGAWLRKSPAKTGDSDLDGMVAALARDIDGFPVKAITVSRMTDDKGKTSVTRRVMEVTELEEVSSISSERFEVPEGYTEVDLLAGLPGAGDTGSSDEEAQPKGLKGLFKSFKKKG